MIFLQLRVRGGICEAAYTHLNLCGSMRWEETGVMILTGLVHGFASPTSNNIQPAENYRVIDI